MNVIIRTRANAPINAAVLSDADFRQKYESKVRKGKTERDHKGGYAKRAAAYKAERIEWKSNRSAGAMPPHLAGGKGNSSKPTKH